jgi:predicted transcriptional regulator
MKEHNSILKAISHSGALDVLTTIANGTSKFTDIMFKTQLNPGILNRLLKEQVKAGIISKEGGYCLTEKGRLVLDHINAINSL